MAVQSDKQSSQSTLLRRALLGNSIFSALSGVVLIAGASPIATFLGVDAPVVLAGIGVALAGYAVLLYRAATGEPLDPRAGMIAVELDVAWVIGSVILLVSGWLPLTAEGKWAIAIIAEIVAVFAIVQYFGVRKLGEDAV